MSMGFCISQETCAHKKSTEHVQIKQTYRIYIIFEKFGLTYAYIGVVLTLSYYLSFLHYISSQFPPTLLFSSASTRVRPPPDQMDLLFPTQFFYTLLHAYPLQYNLLVPLRSIWSTLIDILVLLSSWYDMYLLKGSDKIGLSQFKSARPALLCIFILWNF